MGGIIGRHKHGHAEHIASSLFVDETLIKGEFLLINNSALRGEFIEFIKSGTWTECLPQVEEQVARSSTMNSHWVKFGYKSPHCMGGTSRHTSTRKADSESEDISSRPSSKYSQKVLSESYTSTNNFQSLQTEQICCIMIAILLPLFLATPNVMCCTTNSDKSDETVHYNVEPVLTQKKAPERLENWLLGSAAMFDAMFLDDYLKASWIEEYIHSMHSLAALVIFSTVNAKKEQSKIVFSNALDRGVCATENGLGANLHELFAQDCSPGGVQQVAKAIFGTKCYKRGLIDSSGLCRLRAMKPVLDATGAHVYMIGIESSPFQDAPSDSNNSSNLPFQQVEDLLLLLPVLVRNFSFQAV